MADKQKKSIWKCWYMIVLYVFVGLIIIGAFLPNNSSDKTIYVCPDGSQVSDSSQCSSSTAQPQSDRKTTSTDTTSKQPITTQTEIPLKVMDLSCEYGNRGWIYVKGRVKNEGDREAKFVKVSIDLFNGDKWVDSDYTYIRNTDLPAGATDSFENIWYQEPILTFTRCEAFVTYS